jgi:hypothetical protein
MSHSAVWNSWTVRRQRVAALLAQRLPQKQIAARMGITHQQVRAHVSAIAAGWNLKGPRYTEEIRAYVRALPRPANVDLGLRGHLIARALLDASWARAEERAKRREEARKARERVDAAAYRAKMSRRA